MVFRWTTPALVKRPITTPHSHATRPDLRRRREKEATRVRLRYTHRALSLQSTTAERMAVGGCTFSSDDIVVKSPTDRRLYRYVQLQNGLCALLVHDPEIYPDGPVLEVGLPEWLSCYAVRSFVLLNCVEFGMSCGCFIVSLRMQAAAAMCVGMGSFSDPFEAQGMAHFLEHMLFMGSTDFPDENEYDRYLSKHGGSSNAYTEAEHTCYHFDVKREFLKGALIRFSQFFISPLVKAEAMEREVLAVDSEFNQVLQSDSCRLQQLQCHTSAPDHAFNRFFWGNKKSLVDAMKKGINLREQILRLYGDNYHGGLMKLVVIGGETLDVLESWVLELFSNVKNGPPLKQEARTEVPIWKAGKLYRLEAVKDVHILNLSWTLPCLRKDYLKKSEDYLAHLIGHEGKGSLLFFLKAKGWATSMCAGVGDEGMHRSLIAYIFGMSIHLTDSGLEKIFEIISYVYQYLKLLRLVSPQEWIFKELQDIGNMEFRFAEQQPQDDYAAELAGLHFHSSVNAYLDLMLTLSVRIIMLIYVATDIYHGELLRSTYLQEHQNLHVYPPEHIIYGDYAFKVWDEEMIKYVLGFFSPENMRVDVVSKSLNKSRDFECEPWFGSRYTEEDISPLLMEMWSNPSEVDTSLHLPAKNEFIPCDFSICADKASIADANYPRCIIDEPLIKFWYKLDRTFKLPRANTYFRITLKGGYNDVKNSLLTELFIHLLKDELNEIIYQASVAKLETSVSLFSDKLELKVYGFNHKLPILLSKVLAVAKSFSPTDDRFKVIKEDMERTLRNTNMKPLSHASYLRLQVLCQSFWDADEKLGLLNNLSLADLKAFIPQLLSQLYIEGLCHGNLLEQEAIHISSIFQSNFSVQPLPVDMRHKEYIMCLPPGADLVRDVKVKNKLETNSVLELYFQIEPEVGPVITKLKALSDLFDEIVEEPLFNQLRTKEQLGYVVDCSPRVTYRILGFCFRVQSSEFNPVYLQGRIESFINGLKELLDGIDDESFENYKSGLIAKLLEKDPSLQYETNRYWGQIIDKRYMFDLSEKEAEELRRIKKNDVVDWYNTYLRQSSPKCRRLAIRVWGCNADWKAANSQASSVQVIEDLTAFKMSSTFYPSVC
ncbi:hypothetical protein RHSIM_Rhsim13G0059900 [Rhododendron simsii]|uniref:Nardilysin-like n=1 Tax=Rhododendron simsii TaxID=118357 RepID=A0A834FYP3_RHOSS|nr:hypothetical protein RHSIM_Rhsim13G0059900 [Rhododendron simsii]